MKMLLSFLTTMALALTLGVAFADEWPTDKSHLFLGTIPFDEVYPVQKAEVVIEQGAMGAAAGGLRVEKSEVIWGSLFGNYESTEVPDAYRTFVQYETAGAMSAAAGGLRMGDVDKGGRIFDSLLGSRGDTSHIPPD